MTQLLTEAWSYEKYLELPDDGNRYELIEGELFVTPAPVTGHQHSSWKLAIALTRFIEVNQVGGVVYYAPYEVHLPNEKTIVQPDLLFIRAENAPTAEDPYFVGVPDIVVEILSKSSKRTDTHVKFGVYESAGVPEYWIVDPKGKSVTVYSLRDGKYEEWIQAVGDEIITSRLLAGLEIQNSSLFL